MFKVLLSIPVFTLLFFTVYMMLKESETPMPSIEGKLVRFSLLEDRGNDRKKKILNAINLNIPETLVLKSFRGGGDTYAIPLVMLFEFDHKVGSNDKLDKSYQILIVGLQNKSGFFEEKRPDSTETMSDIIFGIQQKQIALDAYYNKEFTVGVYGGLDDPRIIKEVTLTNIENQTHNIIEQLQLYKVDLTTNNTVTLDCKFEELNKKRCELHFSADSNINIHVSVQGLISPEAQDIYKVYEDLNKAIRSFFRTQRSE